MTPSQLEEKIWNACDRIQINAERAALESNPDKRHAFLQQITHAKVDIIKAVKLLRGSD